VSAAGALVSGAAAWAWALVSQPATASIAVEHANVVILRTAELL
jgi:hypothetical protein